MKYLPRLLALAILAFAASNSHAQSRDLGSRRLLLDDGVGGRLTISYLGPGNSNFIIPPGGATTVPMGTLAGQTLAWDGTVWQAMSNLMNAGGNVTVPTGNFSVTLGTITGDGSGLTTLNASNISSGALALARISTAGALNDQVLRYDGANLGYGYAAAGSLILPLSQQANVAATMLSLTNDNGTFGAGYFGINSVGSIADALRGQTNGGGPGVRGVSVNGPGLHGESDGGRGISATSTNATAAYFTTSNPANTSTTLDAFNQGQGYAAKLENTDVTFGTPVLFANHRGLGITGLFTSDNATNNSPVLYTATPGSGAGIYASSTSGAGGIFSGATGVLIQSGSLVGSYTSIASGATIPANVTTVLVGDDGGGIATANVPVSGTNGQIIVAATADVDGLMIGGVSVTTSESILLTYIGGTWHVK